MNKRINGITTARHILITCAVVFLTLIFALNMGSVRIRVADIVRILFSGGADVSPVSCDIILRLRFSRVILSFLVGASLSVAGCILQGVLRNPLADPYIVGASSGASVGAAVAILLTNAIGMGFRVSLWGLGTIPPFAFIGAVGTVLTVYRVARINDKVPIVTLLLAGVAVSTVLSAIMSLLVYFTDDVMHPLIYWLMGSFSSRGWRHVLVICLYPFLGLLIALRKSIVLDAFAMGEEKAQQLGVDVEREKRTLLVVAALLTGAAVSVSGVISFVGLLVPHVVRLVCGPNHRQLVWRSFIWGGCFLVLADVVARTVISPTEIPIGIITSLCGGPFFIYLLKREQGKYWGGVHE